MKFTIQNPHILAVDVRQVWVAKKTSLTVIQILNRQIDEFK